MKGYLQYIDFMRIYRSPKGRYKVSNGLLLSSDRLCVPNIYLRKELLHDFHTIACPGYLGEKDTSKTKSVLFLENPPQRFSGLCQNMLNVSTNKRPFGLLQPIEPPDSKWSVVTMDIIGPLPETKDRNRHILNVVD